MGKKTVFFILMCLVFSTAVLADQPSPEKITEKKPENVQEIFALGRSVGITYYHLIELCEKARSQAFSELQRDYSVTFQNINIIDIILNDLDLQGNSSQDLHYLRKSFYDALKNQDLNETSIAFVRDMFVVFYENLAKDIKNQYCQEEGWFLSLGFYTAFQLESLKQQQEEKILLSGFDKLFRTRPVQVPGSVYTSLLAVNNLDKPSVTKSELKKLEKNLINITNFFSNYSNSQAIIKKTQDLAGVWQGILINPENEKHDIRLTANKDNSATMDIAGIAGNVVISDVQIVDNYFTFMFKPFGTEKMFMKFNAKLSEDIFTGEITDVLGAKGHWVLARTDEEYKLSDEKLDTMVSYIAKIEEKLKRVPREPVVPINYVKEQQEDEEEEIQEVEYEVYEVDEELKLKKIDREIMEILQQPASKEKVSEKETTIENSEDNNVTNKKSYWQKLKSFFGNIFRF